MTDTSRTSRRALLAGAAATPLASATALASKGPALGEGDAELRRLWAEYLTHADAYAAARAKYEPVREAFDAERPPCPDDVLPGHHWEACQPLWNKYGLEILNEAWNVAADQMQETKEAILATEATSLFGIGVKLAALPAHHPDPEDYEEAITSVCDDIDRLQGSDFAEHFENRGADEVQS